MIASPVAQVTHTLPAHGCSAVTVDSLIDAAFHPALGRSSRSNEYRAGVKAVLMARLTNKPLAQPFKRGTTEADAFFAGTDEGRVIWAEHIRAQQISDHPRIGEQA